MGGCEDETMNYALRVSWTDLGSGEQGLDDRVKDSVTQVVSARRPVSILARTVLNGIGEGEASLIELRIAFFLPAF